MKCMITVLLLKLIKFYRLFISPLMAPRCRFHPTCSSYSYEAIKNHGLRGVPISIFRILKCNPFGSYGYDPVPVSLNNIFQLKRNNNEPRY